MISIKTYRKINNFYNKLIKQEKLEKWKWKYKNVINFKIKTIKQNKTNPI